MTGEWNVPDSSDPMSSDFNSHCVCFLARSTGRPIDRSLSIVRKITVVGEVGIPALGRLQFLQTYPTVRHLIPARCLANAHGSVTSA